VCPVPFGLFVVLMKRRNETKERAEMLPVWREMAVYGSERAEADANLGQLAKNAQRALRGLGRGLRTRTLRAAHPKGGPV
jgi:hypothetical protein